MTRANKNTDLQNLPAAAEFIELLIKKMRYRRKVREDVRAELFTHFEDALKDCTTDEQKEKMAAELIAGFGDARLLGILLRRAKKRCRPLWRTVIARTFQTAGVLILCFIVYLAWFLSGRPVISTNYLAQLNRIVRPPADESLNAAPFYKEAAELYEKNPDEIKTLLMCRKCGDANEQDKQVLEKWMSENKQIFDLVVAGSQQPYYWQDYKTPNDTNEVMSIVMPELATLRSLTYMLQCRLQLSARDRRYDDAFGDIETCYRFGRHFSGDKTLIEQLVGIAIRAVATWSLRDILAEHDIGSLTLQNWQKDFEQLITDKDFVISMEVEKMFKYDTIQRSFTEDYFGGGHLYIPRLRTLLTLGDLNQCDKTMKFQLAVKHLSYIARALFMHPNKQQTRQMADRLCAFWQQIARKSPAQLRGENIDVEKQAMEIVKGNVLLEILVPAYGRVSSISYRLPADVRATLTIMALLRYRQDTGSYPSDLDELVTAGYLKQLPLDPWSDKPLVYKKTDNNFILYSVGFDFTDDGGEVFRNEKGTAKIWADKGDAVFWPIQKN